MREVWVNLESESWLWEKFEWTLRVRADYERSLSEPWEWELTMRESCTVLGMRVGLKERIMWAPCNVIPWNWHEKTIQKQFQETVFVFVHFPSWAKTCVVHSLKETFTFADNYVSHQVSCVTSAFHITESPRTQTPIERWYMFWFEFPVRIHKWVRFNVKDMYRTRFQLHTRMAHTRTYTFTPSLTSTCWPKRSLG